MARKRMIDPQFFLDEDLASLSAHARLLYIGMWTIADDMNATFPNRPKWIKAQIFPYENVNVEKLLDELSSSSHVILFTDPNKEEFWYLPSFRKHQRIDRPSKSKYAEFDPKLVTSSSSPRTEIKLKEIKRREIYNSITSLNEFVVNEVADQYSVSVKAVMDLKDDLILYVKRNAHPYKDYKAALQTWVRSALKDKKIAKIATSAPAPAIEVSPEELQANRLKLQEIRSQFRLKSI